MQRFRKIVKKGVALVLSVSILLSLVIVGEVNVVSAATSTNYGASDFGTLLEEATQFIVVKHKQLGGSHYAYTAGISDDENTPMDEEYNFLPGSEMVLVKLYEQRGTIWRSEETLLSSSSGVIRDPDVSEDGKKVLFSWKKDGADDYHLYEMTIASKQYTQLTFGNGIADVEPKYLGNGKIVFNSTRCISTVDCWKTPVMNMYTCNADGTDIMRLGYDQVHTTYPTTTEDGRILYTRWDYNDRNQMYVQAVFQMFPDGTNQTEVFGNNSNYPTTLLHTREVPGSAGVYISISSGHHTRQAGKLVLVDTSIGRNDADAVTYPFWDSDCQKNESDDPQGQRGALYKYPVALNDHEFLVSYCESGWASDYTRTQFGIYYMNSETGTKIRISDPESEYGASQVAMVKEKDLFERPSMVNQAVEYGTYYMGNVYAGGGLEGVEPGTAKYLRAVEIEYRPYAIGATIGIGTGSSDPYTPVSTGNGAWDVKRVLGIVPIEEDGSALFRVPANTPIYFQVLNADGEMIQSMRSWSTLMPNETFSCVGCHEDKNTVPPYQYTTTIAMKNGVQELQPDLWMTEEDGTEYEEGEYDVEEDTKGFSYTEMVQPILDANCISCHNDSEISQSMIGGGYSSSGGTQAGVSIDKDGIPLVDLGSNFKYTTTMPENNDWILNNNFNDASWKNGNAPFGTNIIQGHASNTKLDVDGQYADLCLRKSFELSEVDYVALQTGQYDVYLRISYDENPMIFLNGWYLYIAEGYITNYIDVKITEAFKELAISGKNQLAVYANNTGGGMFLDFGIYLVPKTILVEKGSSFRYTTEKLSGNAWTQVGYDDASWATGNAPFGTEKINGNSPNTNLNVENLYLRSSFMLSQDTYDKIKKGEYDVYINISWDEDPAIYLNGTSILKRSGYITVYESIKITSAFLATAKVGENTLAASLINTAGGQFLDFSIYLAEADADSTGTAFSLEGIDVVGPRERILYSLSYLVLTDSEWRANGDGGNYVGNSTNDYTNWISSMSQCEMLDPYQFGSTQSQLITLLKNGHEGISLTKKEIQTIAAWIDLGVPFRGAYDERNNWDAWTNPNNWNKDSNREATEKQNKRDYYDAIDLATKRISSGAVATDKLPITVSYMTGSGSVVKDITDNGMAILYPETKYTSGYKVMVTLPKGVEYFFFSMDPRMDEALIYCPSGTYTYTIPSDAGEIFPHTFMSASHPTITARIATAEELKETRNLAVNPYDVSTNASSATAYPHAFASTQNDTSEFAARNAIDGSAVNNGHGTYPVQSWGAKQTDKAMWYQIDFGTAVFVDTVDITVRADWNNNYDAYFTNAVLEFSDGTTQTITLTKTSDTQSFSINGGKKQTTYVKIKNLTATGGQWAAISEVEVYGSALPEEEIPLTGISIDATASLIVGQTKPLAVTYLPATTTDNKTVEWTSSAPSVATVDSKGNITALRAGTTTITAKVGSFTDTCVLTVKNNTVFSIKIIQNPDKLTYIVGEVLNTDGMKLQVTYANGTATTISRGWTPSPNGTLNTVGTQTITISYGGKTTTYTVTVKSKVPSQITSSPYIVDQTNRYISKIKVGTTVSTLLNGINEKAYCKVYNGNTQITGSTVVGTGMTIKLMDGNTVVKTYTIVVTGDVNGDGKINITDLVQVNSHILGKTTLTGAKAKAADVNGDGKINITDLVQINSHILGKGTITAR